MIPGLLDTKPDIVPITRVGVSLLSALRRCRLRGVWTINRQAVLLPRTPAARLGTAIHSLLAEAGAGAFVAADLADIRIRWTEILYLAEQEMSHAWLERHLVPLSASVLGFEVRSVQAVGIAEEISTSIRQRDRSSPGHSSTSRNEVWVQTRDGLVGGFIDRVIATPQGPVICDYKSGSVFQRNRGANSKKLRESYALQMKLYAALYYVWTGEWPFALELVPLQGDRVRVPFEHSDCMELLDGAVNMLNETNSLISASNNTSEIEHKLANPSSEACRTCLYRPACRLYHERRHLIPNSKDWPVDLRGLVTEMHLLGNGTYLLGVQPEHSRQQSCRVRGLNQAPDRHPALLRLSPGDRVALYDLNAGGSNSTFSESRMSTIYRVL